MIYDFVWEEMEECDAEGVDFVPISFECKIPPEIHSSFTKEQWKTQNYIPKTSRKYWRINEKGGKIYID